jgi:hypothetical protein
VLRQLSEKSDQAKSIVEITEGIYKSRIPVLDDGSQVVLRCFLDVLFS